MKLFDVDWAALLQELHRYTDLPVAARRLLVEELKLNGYVPMQHFGSQLDVVVASGIPMFDAQRERLWLHEEHRALLKVLRAMHRQMVFDEPTLPNLTKYIEEHFAQDAVNMVAQGLAGVFMHTHRIHLAQRVAFAGWPGDLLSAEDDRALLNWATQRGLTTTSAAHTRVLRALQTLAKKLVISHDGVPLRDILAECSSEDIPMLGQAIHAGLGTLVFFAALRNVDFEPMIGLWPPAARELTRPPAQAPATVVPVIQYGLPVRMEDMTTVLAAIAGAPLRVRAADYAVFARASAEIQPRLVALPTWAAGYYASPHFTRVDEIARQLSAYRFVQLESLGINPHLVCTAAGEAWLAGSPQDRLMALVQPLRKSKEVNPVGAYSSGESVRFFPFTLPYLEAPKAMRLRETITRAFLQAAAGFIVLEQFLDYETRENNPFIAFASSFSHSAISFMHFPGGDPRESYRHLWRNSLTDFLSNRLLAFGGATLGQMADGQVCFALTDIGRYLLGSAENFSYGSDASSDVVVQPNFDVVFWGAAPSVEAALARFAERVGTAPGLAFRITRASVLGAAERGVTADAVMAALSAASSKPVPKNVQREIAGWMATVRRVSLRAVEIIECADEEAATRVIALLGTKVRRISATMFELPVATGSSRAALLKRLRTGGVFVADATTRAKASRQSVERWIIEDE